jgi:hypothetical protein
MQDDEKWWPLSAALAWIAARKPLRFDEWDDSIAAPRAAALAIRPIKGASRDAAMALAAQDDGVAEELARLGRELFQAAAAERVAIKGRPSAESDAELVAILPGYFTRKALAAFPADETLGRDDSAETEAPRMGGGAKVHKDFPWWFDVEVDAHALRREWPQDDAFQRALAWMRAHGRAVKKQDESDVQQATGVSRAIARRAFDQVFGRPAKPGRRPKAG